MEQKNESDQDVLHRHRHSRRDFVERAGIAAIFANLNSARAWAQPPAKPTGRRP